MDPTRRDFLKTVVLIGAIAPAPLLESACSNVAPTSTGNPRTQPSGTFDVDLTAHPALANDDSVVTISGTPAGTIFMTHTTGDSYFALSRICTHQGCTVGATTPTLNCPCHGSRYSLSGSVVQGPAQAALRGWPVTRTGDTLTIDFG